MAKTIADAKQAVLDAIIFALEIVEVEQPDKKKVKMTRGRSSEVKEFAEALHTLTVCELTVQDAGVVENIGRKLAEHEILIKTIVNKVGLK